MTNKKFSVLSQSSLYNESILTSFYSICFVYLPIMLDLDTITNSPVGTSNRNPFFYFTVIKYIRRLSEKKFKFGTVLKNVFHIF